MSSFLLRSDPPGHFPNDRIHIDIELHIKCRIAFHGWAASGWRSTRFFRSKSKWFPQEFRVVCLTTWRIPKRILTRDLFFFSLIFFSPVLQIGTTSGRMCFSPFQPVSFSLYYVSPIEDNPKWWMVNIAPLQNGWGWIFHLSLICLSVCFRCGFIAPPPSSKQLFRLAWSLVTPCSHRIRTNP